MKAIDLGRDVVLVTGGAGDIGRATCRELASAGAGVIVGDLVADDARQVAAAITDTGGRAVGAGLDVRDADSVEAAIAEGTRALGPLTGLVNVAAVLRTGRVEEMPPAQWREIHDVNVTGTFLAAKAAVPHLRASGGGGIVNVSSVSAFIASDGGSAYSATKGAVLSFTYAIAGELAPYGIRVNAVCPGWVDGGFTDRGFAGQPDVDRLRAEAAAMHLLGRMASPAEVGNAVCFLLSDLASFVTGTALFVDGGYLVRH